ncbi:hypothetical protein ACSNOH_27700 [Streptomyces sp. URMC 127]|uniref:hypothetical protein n=1 Tax=Streptomyces sp. URMC 127 TaxID=3423402 RepID=UPI003F19D956
MAVGRTRKKKKNQNRKTSVWEGRTVAAGCGAGALTGRSAEASSRAAEDDRLWFDKHPGASVRVREALPGEHDHGPFTQGRKPLWPDERLTVVVVQVVPGRRVRYPYKAVSVASPDERLTPQQLEAVREEWEASDQTMPLTAPDGQTFDYLMMFRLAMAGQSPTAEALERCRLG